MSIQAVSYLSGNDRYGLLKNFQSPENTFELTEVWSKFYNDAAGNSAKVLEYLSFQFSEFEEKLNQTLVAEDLMMSGIYRNGGVMV